MIESILRNTSIEKCLNNTVAGTGDTLNGDIIDLGSGGAFDSVCFILTTGDVAATAVGTLKAYVGDASNLSDGAYVTSTATFTATASSADNECVVLDVVKPGKRYIRPDFVRATANIPVESVVSLKYNSKALGVTQGADVIASAISVNRG